METINIPQDIKVVCLKASSFPEGIKTAHETLHASVPMINDRKYYGLSKPNEQGVISYFSAAEELFDGELAHLNLSTIILKKGNYYCIDVPNYLNDLNQIGNAFKILTSQTNIDLDAYCIEWYVNFKDLKCLLRIND